MPPAITKVKLFVGGLAWECSKESLSEAFADYNPLDVYVPMNAEDETKSRGFGFVTVKTADEAARCVIEMNGKELDGRTIKVDLAANGKGGGGGGGSGGGGAGKFKKTGGNAVPLGGGRGGGGGARASSGNEDSMYGKKEEGGGGGDADDDADAAPKEERNFETSGLLTEETNTINGVVVVYSEPSEARKSKIQWRLYEFKGTLHAARLIAGGWWWWRGGELKDLPAPVQLLVLQFSFLMLTYNKYTIDVM